MEIEIYHGTQPMGKLSIRQQGLYLYIQGSLDATYALHRIYGIRGEVCEYLGIVDLQGQIRRRVSARSLSSLDYCLLSPLGPQEFMLAPKETTPEPEEGDAPEASTTASELHRIPEREEPQQIEQTERGKKNETDEEMLGSVIDPLLLADLPADYDYGQGGEQEAHCNHL